MTAIKLVAMNEREIDLAIEALAKAASRHETYARKVKHFKKHNDIAARMRALRLKLVQTKPKSHTRHLTALAPSLSS